MVTDFSLNRVTKVFSHISLARGYNDCFRDEDIKNRQDFPTMYKQFSKSFEDIVNHPEIEHQSTLKDFPCAIGYFLNFRDEIRQFFTIKPELVIESDFILEKELKFFNLTRDQATLVSVHVRRGDYEEQAIDYGMGLPKVEYYIEAFKFYRKRYQNVIFVIISSEFSWCKESFRKETDVIYPGNGIEKDPALDFVLMTRCDHHIIGLGTYSFTSAFLGKGTIAYDVSDKNISQYEFIDIACGPSEIYIPILTPEIEEKCL